MPGCAAVGCNNRSEKGYIMKCFPRDAKLRKIWQERVGRADWEPSNNSFLCHVHFKPQEWSITNTGRIKLKKGAVPSIFTITSTRKSPKKRMITNQAKPQTNPDIDVFDVCDNDTEYSSTGNVDINIGEYINDSVVHPNDIQNEEVRKDSETQIEYQILTADSEGNLIITPDTKIEELTSDNIILTLDNNLTENINVSHGSCKNKKNNSKCILPTEFRVENVSVNNDVYDEIEEKLKLICHQDPTEGRSSSNKKSNQQQKFGRRKNSKNISDNMSDVANGTNSSIISSDKSFRNEISQILINKKENVEIIFDTESGEDTLQMAQNTEIKNNFSENLDESFTKEEVRVIPNIRAAMKRKRRTREEILESIKKSIGSASDNELSNFYKVDLANNTHRILEEKGTLSEERSPKQKICKLNDSDCTKNISQFTVKVIGNVDDVNEVTDNLPPNASKSNIETIDTSNKDDQNQDKIISVLTVQEFKNDSPKNTENSLNPESLIIKNETYITDEEASFNNNQSTILSNNIASKELNSSLPPQCIPVDPNLTHIEDLQKFQRQVKIQENVIENLTNQIIMYKKLENDLLNKNIRNELKMRELEAVLSKQKRAMLSSSGLVGRRTLESKQRLIQDLSNRMSLMDNVNKKLMKNVTLESQEKRKLEGQIKQRDDKIKELNWKLEKASKYLDRAEKNANTYRRKMLNMQTTMRRRKMLEEKVSAFSEMLFNNARGEFSEQTLTTAREIKHICKLEGYKKLINYGFPLPPLSALEQQILGQNTDSHENNDNVQNNIESRVNDVKNEPSEVSEKSEILETNLGDVEIDDSHTVTGTVQDIFDENNDGDFSTNELREHFIMELNTVI